MFFVYIFSQYLSHTSNTALWVSWFVGASSRDSYVYVLCVVCLSGIRFVSFGRSIFVRGSFLSSLLYVPVFVSLQHTTNRALTIILVVPSVWLWFLFASDVPMCCTLRLLTPSLSSLWWSINDLLLWLFLFFYFYISFERSSLGKFSSSFLTTSTKWVVCKTRANQYIK